MQLIIADEAGFCTGVRRAFHISEEMANSEGKWFTLGPLVHNKAVVDYFSQNGIEPLEDINNLAGDGIIIRSHGVSPQAMAVIQEKGLMIRDATCPLVKKVHEAARLLQSEGYDIIVFGDIHHPEVQGIMGWCNHKAQVITSIDEVQSQKKFKKLGIISQTTRNENEFLAVVEALLPRAQEIRVFNTICSATRKRQEAARLLSAEVDCMLVIGDRNSSNTKTLAQECQNTGVATHVIESAQDLNPEWFKAGDKVGVSAGASTPDWIIKEVLDRMTQFDDGAPQEQIIQETQMETNAPRENDTSEENFAKMEAEMADIVSPSRGDIIKGIVVEVHDDDVMVDVGGKSEGIIPLREMSVKDVSSAKLLATVGEEIEVLVLKWDDDGTILLSKKKVDSKRAMDKLEETFNEGGIVEGTITSSVKGGLLVDVGVIAFLPASHVEDGYVKNLDEYIGKTYSFKIIEFNRNKKRGSQIVLSRKQLVEAEKSKLKEQFWATIEEGQVLKGRIKRLVDYGAFIDLGGFEGLLHVSEIDHVRVEHPSAVFNEGDEIEVYILALDREKQRVSLSRKKLLKSPWEIVMEKYAEGDIVEGKVVRIAPFGAFVEIEPGVDGLVHISQLANYRVEKPQDVVAVSQIIRVKILSIDQEEKRIGLSLKEAAESLQEEEVQEYLQNQEGQESQDDPEGSAADE
ncbi:MAG: bifunctional 4-hydroxy-3-methylbut-2-enyl diphosphate reductase/30S ribosomal protein S1 [Syntrophomonadaceae bacterium]|nr:bifunctional 4-hydroxy-3-methylbut-2-enyl diphosphate reductase/30S ribosomal protein S1 [Syntrophomonadaceae bacterium]